MKIKSTVLLFLLTLSATAQGYYPSFSVLFLNDEDELFSPELSYFKNELKVISQKLYLGDIQTSVSNDNSSVFYGFKVVPKIKEYNFLNAAVFLKINVDQNQKHASFPATFAELIDREEKTGSGIIQLEMFPGIALAFDQKFIKVWASNLSSINNDKAEFRIKEIEYKIDKTNLEIKFQGAFVTDIFIKGKKIKKTAISNLTLNAEKMKFSISYFDDAVKKNILIMEQKIL
ncbi:hypothetical protein [Flavobacterium hungaricum]|uniref:Uncharacterized protein n=1 Tax=Flavobacterium hungaricum TaxID=2082725 RepID=A0ABR9TFW7_9FLAO|nr:hypothetical protein [Flavobacterium hungaricum]MBE8724238.1 hypothetical protein [Flavobacterium hungaricum]